MKKVAFNTANLVGQVTGWRFDLARWGEQDRLTRQQTDERAWARICVEIAAAGYRAVEIWVAHVDPPQMTDSRARTYRQILDDHGLQPIGLAGALNEENARVCQQLGITVCNGGYWGSDPATVKRLMRSTGIGFNYENHPETSPAEIREQIAELGEGAGIALDTGWLGTRGIDPVQAVRELGTLVKHVHVKDVVEAGGHHTCPLGEGVVDLPGTFAALKAIGYDGWYSWEDEPEDRNPMEIAARMRTWIEERIG